MKKRLIRIGKPIGYLLLLIGIIFGTIALVYYGQGYIYDRDRGEIVGGGLVLLNSTPRNADIWVDGSHVDSTPRRVRRAAGTYEFSLYLEGYREWRKRIEVTEGRVVNAEYPILIPNNVETGVVSALSSPLFISQSSDQRQLVVAENGTPDRLRLLDRNGSDLATVFELAGDYSGWSIDDVRWSADNSYLLVRAVSRSRSVHFLARSEAGADVTVIEDLFADDRLDDVGFGGRNGTLYALAGGTLHSVTEAKDTAIVAESVAAFTTVGDSVFLIAAENNGSALYRYRGNGTELLHEIPRRPEGIELRYTGYGDDPVAIVRDVARKQVTLLHDLGGKVYTESLPLLAADEIMLSPNGRFLLMRNGLRFVTYDFGSNTMYDFALRRESVSPLAWYDSHHLIYSDGRSVIIMDFDGTNQEQLAEAGEYSPYGNARRSIVYSIGRNHVTGRPVLQRSHLE